MKHLNPRQGITTRSVRSRRACAVSSSCVKHLNPRQGITTGRVGVGRRRRRVRAGACETPKSPPGDYNALIFVVIGFVVRRCVKHLNPRQGITTLGTYPHHSAGGVPGVKHLNPRQGITTRRTCAPPSWSAPTDRCETPKSPPGDYNAAEAGSSISHRSSIRVKHLNPRQGITTKDRNFMRYSLSDFGVKHLNPRQGITTGERT